MRRLPIGLVALAVIGLLLLPTVTNVAANSLPGSWGPYLWLAWPVALILGAPAIYIEVRERHRLHDSVSLDDNYGKDSQDALSREARHDLSVAVRDQWMEEAGVRSLCSPEPMRVSFSGVGRSMARELPKVLKASASDGPLGKARGDISDVTGMLREVRSRQLVILGGPASGKTVMALLLTLDLLSDSPNPEKDEPTPVLLSISAWNPHTENLHSWISRRTLEEYPALANSNSYGAEAVTRLVSGKRIIPILDGLDEMAEALRPAAIVAVDKAITDQYPLVLTCRTNAYEAAVHESGRMLAHAAVVEIQPGTIEQAMDSSARRFRRLSAGSRWEASWKTTRAVPSPGS